MPQAPIFAVALNVARVRMRAVAISIVVFCASFVGQVVGPLLIGVLNDLLAPRFGAQSVRYSMLILAVTAALAGLQCWLGARTIEADLRRAAEEPQPS